MQSYLHLVDKCIILCNGGKDTKLKKIKTRKALTKLLFTNK